METQLTALSQNIINQLANEATLQEIRPLPGSFSNETTLLEYETAVGTEQVVVRRYAVFGEYDRGKKAEREFKTLALLHKHGIPVPQPLLLDKSGDLLGSPGIVTSFVPGQQLIQPSDESAWVTELAMLGGEPLADAFLAAYEQEFGRSVANLAFWELAAAARFLPTPEGMIAEWQSLQAGVYDETAVQQNFRNLLASALQRAGTIMEKNSD